MKNRILVSFAAALSLVFAGGASAQPSASGLTDGIAAYRAGDVETAWPLLAAASEDGAIKAKRYLAYIMLDGETPKGREADLFKGVALLKEAALAGDYAALIRLENLRRKHLAHSPSLDDMIAIEEARAEEGDPVVAWRLAKRFEMGDGVEVSEAGMTKWLEVAASAEPARFPKAGEAAYRLCELNALGREAKDPDAARRWCAVAAENGHMGAAIVLKRLAQLQG
ncbi:sel1 repeat family protein [Hyphococcus luteus]|uniref:Sel1 repeat family protein n=1 Tax=Hyphococcus luteus TaxID=2058213 RepID=A0A2S7K7Y7_9PROT|nr:sel1 repeat family protein [Marinicaulis flavus]PQA88606.1 hypothetical protein CW354_10015 [Marinicaulis flavus]